MFLNVLIESPIRFSLGAPLESDFACVLCLQANPGHGCVFPRKNPPAVYSWLCLEPPRPQGSPQGWCPCRGVRAGAAHGIGTRSMSPEHDPGTGAQQQLLGLSQSREAALN